MADEPTTGSRAPDVEPERSRRHGEANGDHHDGTSGDVAEGGDGAGGDHDADDGAGQDGGTPAAPLARDGESLQTMHNGDDDGPSVTEPRVGEPVVVDGAVDTARTWFFLVGNRYAVAGVTLLGMLVLLALADAALGLLDPNRPGALYYAFGGLIGGNFTLVAIVISINQLVVSQQIGAPGELRGQIEATNAYREAVEESMDVSVAPVTPTEFLHLLLRSTADAIESVRESSADDRGDEADEQLRRVTDGIDDHVRHVDSLLTRPEVSVFQALSAALDTNYSDEMYRLRRLRHGHGDAYSSTVVDALDDLVVRIQQIDVARQYLKTIYVQNELSRLSRNLLYVGIPAVLVPILVLRAFAAPESALLSPAQVSAAVPLAIAASLAPLSVLFAYVIRLSTVAQRTVAITPFTTAAQEQI